MHCLPVAPSSHLNDSTVSGGGGEEDVDDAEYNYLADTHFLEEEKEEFRDDRAVRISSELWGEGVILVGV